MRAKAITKFYLSHYVDLKTTSTKPGIFWAVKLEAVAWRCSVKKVFLEIWQNPQKSTCAKAFFLKSCRRFHLHFHLWHRCFPVNLTKFLGIPFLTEHLWWLLLQNDIFVEFYFAIPETQLYSPSWGLNGKNIFISFFNTLSANPTKWSNTLKQFVSFCRRIVWMCLTIL